MSISFQVVLEGTLTPKTYLVTPVTGRRTAAFQLLLTYPTPPKEKKGTCVATRWAMFSFLFFFFFSSFSLFSFLFFNLFCWGLLSRWLRSQRGSFNPCGPLMGLRRRTDNVPASRSPDSTGGAFSHPVSASAL